MVGNKITLSWRIQTPLRVHISSKLFLAVFFLGSFCARFSEATDRVQSSHQFFHHILTQSEHPSVEPVWNNLVRLLANPRDVVNHQDRLKALVPEIAAGRVSLGDMAPQIIDSGSIDRNRFYGSNHYGRFPDATVDGFPAYGIRRDSLGHEAIWSSLASQFMNHHVGYFGWLTDPKDNTHVIHLYRSGSGPLLKLTRDAWKLRSDESPHNVVSEGKYANPPSGSMVERNAVVKTLEEFLKFHNIMDSNMPDRLKKEKYHLEVYDPQLLINTQTIIDFSGWELIVRDHGEKSSKRILEKAIDTFE